MRLSVAIERAVVPDCECPADDGRVLLGAAKLLKTSKKKTAGADGRQ